MRGMDEEDRGDRCYVRSEKGGINLLPLVMKPNSVEVLVGG